MSPVTGLVLVLYLYYMGVSAKDGPITKPKEDHEISIIKPGRCPLELDYPTCESSSLIPQCSNDGDCGGKRKCCSSGCIKRCLLPLEDKINACPYFNHIKCAIMKPSPSECHGDDQCQGTERCCCFNCRNECKPTVKPGQCPAKPFCPETLPPSTCKTDNDCSGEKKCCDMCGQQCVSPQKEHAGVCKTSLENLSCIDLKKSLCTSDSDCAMNQKCCLSGNDRQCEVATDEKPGMCPIIMTKCSGSAQTAKCHKDSDCPGNKKCCTKICTRECTEPSP